MGEVVKPAYGAFAEQYRFWNGDQSKRTKKQDKEARQRQELMESTDRLLADIEELTS